MADAADEVRLHGRAAPEGLVDLGMVEAAHRAAAETEGARGEDEVAALDARVAKCRRVGEVLLADEPRLRVGVREEPGQLVVERVVGADDRRDRRRLGLATLPGETQATNFSRAAGVRTKTIRAGDELAEVGAHFIRS